MLNAVITATGMKGSGKTTKVRALVEPCRRALIVDPEAKWAPAPGDVVARGAGELLAHLGALGASDPAQPFRIIYRDDVEQLQSVPFVLAFALRNLTVVCDEWAWITTASAIPAPLKRLIQFGRERRINLVGTTREPQEVHNLLFSQADLVLIFHTEEGYGLDRLRRWYRDLADMVPRLTIHDYRARGDERITALLGREGLAIPAALLHPFPHETRRRR